MNSNNKKFIKKKEIFKQLKKENNSNKILTNNYGTNPNKKKLDNKEKIIPKQKYNIDLFLGVKEQFQNEKSTNNNNNNNIYLNFYNKHTKNQIQKENKLGKKFLENNKEYIKEKQEKFKIKKEQEEKKRKQKEKEDTNEYRKLQMTKLYKMESLYKKEIIKRKNTNKSGMKYNIKNNKEEIKVINSNNKNSININKTEDGNKMIKITREEYDNKLDSLIKQTRIYLNELEKLPIANKSNKIYEREIQLNKNIDEIQKQIKKYQLYEGIEIVEN